LGHVLLAVVGIAGVVAVWCGSVVVFLQQGVCQGGAVGRSREFGGDLHLGGAELRAGLVLKLRELPAAPWIWLLFFGRWQRRGFLSAWSGLSLVVRLRGWPFLALLSVD
jgi:hypothetical protein